jgi:hypothetical protein
MCGVNNIQSFSQLWYNEAIFKVVTKKLPLCMKHVTADVSGN